MMTSLKQALNKAQKSGSMESQSFWLPTEPCTPHSVTAGTMAELLLGRFPRIRLSLIHPCMLQRRSLATEQKLGNKFPRVFKVGQAVLL